MDEDEAGGLKFERPVDDVARRDQRFGLGAGRQPLVTQQLVGGAEEQAVHRLDPLMRHGEPQIVVQLPVAGDDWPRLEPVAQRETHRAPVVLDTGGGVRRLVEQAQQPVPGRSEHRRQGAELSDQPLGPERRRIGVYRREEVRQEGSAPVLLRRTRCRHVPSTRSSNCG